MDIEKIYYTIGQVAEITDLPQSVLRYWETVFKQLAPDKSDGGTRHYSKEDIDIILKIKNLLYNEGFTIKGARKRLRDIENDPQAKAEQEEMKEKHIAPEKYSEGAGEKLKPETGSKSGKQPDTDYQAIIAKLKQIIKILDE